MPTCKQTKEFVKIKHQRIQEIEKAANLGLGLKKPLFETVKEYGMSTIVKELEQLAQKHGQFYEPDPLLVTMQ